jgi:arylsulfatase A-like enzyme
MHPLDDIILPPVIDDDLADIPEIALLGGQEGGVPPMGIHEWILEDTENIRWKEGVQAYLASITFADAMLGHLLDALEQSGRAENTIIVLWSDQGWHLGEKSRWRKTTLWRETTRVPFIVVAPGVTQPGSRSATTVSLMDLYPTLVELAGMDVPDHVEGVSLVPILKNPSTPSERRAVSTNGFKNHAVSGEQYRYLRYSDGSEELYDILSDPHEWKNLAADPAMAATKAELAEWLPTHNEPDVGKNRE